MVNRGLKEWERKNKMARRVRNYLMPWSGYGAVETELIAHPITKSVVNGKIPSVEEARLVGGDETTLKLFYLTLALLSDIKRRESNKPYFLHPFNVAIKPDYRYDDPLMPSNYRQIPYEKSLGLIHDLEVVLGSLEGFYVLQDSLRHSLGPRLTQGLEDLTNENEWVLYPIKRSLKELAPDRYKQVDAEDIISGLNRRLNILNSSTAMQTYNGFIATYYQTILGKLDKFAFRVRNSELSANDQNFIRDIVIDSFANPIRKRVGAGDIFEPKRLIEVIGRDLEHVLSIVKGIGYEEADKNLIHIDESRYLVTLEKTLYKDFVERKIMKKAEEEYDGNHSADNPPLSNPIVKTSDVMANVSTLEYDIPHAISQFRKSRQVRESGSSLVERLKEKGAGQQVYQRFVAALDYSRRNLILRLIEHYMTSYQKARNEDSYIEDMRLLGYMLTKEDVDLKQLLKRNQSWIGDMQRLVGFL